MRNKILLLFVSVVTMLMSTSCSKEYYDTKTAGEDFLAANKEKTGVVELLPSGIQYEVVFNNPSGAYPLFKEAHNLVIKVKYGSYFIDPDTTAFIKNTGEQMITLSNAEPFWSVIIPKMRIGSIWRVWVPYEFAFKEAGLNEKDDGSFDIDPYTVLRYEIELIDAY